MTIKALFPTLALLSIVTAACSNEPEPESPDPDDELRAALSAALRDEQTAEATYEAVMKQHGEVRPFSNVIRAERRHQEELVALFSQYRIPVPARTMLSIDAPATVADACAQAVAAEVANIELYDRLLAKVKAEDVRATFIRLQRASRERHLPAFKRCTQRGRR